MSQHKDIERHMPVISKDGKYLGLVERIVSGEIVLAGNPQPIPIEWVSCVMQREVYLCKSKNDIERVALMANLPLSA